MTSAKDKKQDLSKSVMEKIQKEEVKMRPHLYFVLGSLLLGVGLAIAFLLAIFFANLFLFNVRAHAPFDYLYFGPPGWRPFIVNLPWLPLLVSLLAVVVGIWLIRRYDFSYKKGLLAIVAGVIVAVVSLGILLNFVGFNEKASRFRGTAPLYHRSLVGRDWVVGEIASSGEEEMIVVTDGGREVTVCWNEDTRLPFGADFGVGETVKAVGRWEDSSTFLAKGIGGVGLREKNPFHKPLLPKGRQNPRYPYRLFPK
jgi:hypothetical protein